MKTTCASAKGFSLVEVVLALGVVSFCVISLLGLVSAGLKSDANSSGETVVASLLTAIVIDLSATTTTTPPTVQTSPQFQISVPASGTVTNTLFFCSDGTLAGPANQNAIPSGNPRYRVTVAIMAPASTAAKTATTVRIFVTWPALADPTITSSPSHYIDSVETMAAFLRN
jgi:uncharacterized protein (TIGR02598 family)